jgi:uroporphyrinogen decarboxylase
MSAKPMTSMERVLATLGHHEPDRVPLFLLPTLHGSIELGMSIQQYFSKGENVAEGQMRLRARLGHDCLDAFFYGAIEVEAWGGEVVYADDGPPTAADPFLKAADLEKGITPPSVADSPRLREVLNAISLLKSRVADTVPIVGVVMSPFSLPVMQLGFDRYIELMSERPLLFNPLMRANEEFCVSWANAQLAAGATAIAYFDPLASPTMTPREVYLRTGHPVACRTISRIKGATAIHLASGASLPILEDIARTGTAIVGVGSLENLSHVKDRCRGKLTVLGNLNGITMRRWSRDQARSTVKEAIKAAGPGGGFILSDSHGEIPLQVPLDTLSAIAEAVRELGVYPLEWV